MRQSPGALWNAVAGSICGVVLAVAPAGAEPPPPAQFVAQVDRALERTPVDAPAGVSIQAQQKSDEIQRQQLVSDLETRLQEAHDLVARSSVQAALDVLRLAQSVVRGAEGLPAADRDALDRRIQAQILSTVRAEERIDTERAEALRREAVAERQTRALDDLSRNEETVNTMMIQFDSLMAQGEYNTLLSGGVGDVAASAAPYGDARVVAQKARALAPQSAAPHAGTFAAETTGFLAQALASEQVKEYRFMLSLQDVDRGAVPFPDTLTVEFPDAGGWRVLSERRTKRYGKAADLLDRGAKTKSILAKLEEPLSMSFATDTPLEDVLKYIRTASQGPNDAGIPIYVDPVGLQEVEKTLQSPVQLDLEGVPLKTTLRLLLKQLGLTYTVKDGLLMVTSETSKDQPMELRVYPVADLAIIPMSLLGGNGGAGGGMGGRGGFGGGSLGGNGFAGGGGMGMFQ